MPERQPVSYRGHRVPGLYLRRGTTFQARVDGRWHTLRAQTVEEARQLTLELQAAPSFSRPKPDKQRLDAYALAWLEGRELSPRSRVLYEQQIRTHLIPLLGRCRVSDLTVEHALLLLEKTRHLAPASQRAILLRLSAICTRAVRDGLLSVNPCSLLTKEERPKIGGTTMKHVFTLGQLERIEACALGTQNASLFVLAATTGLRLSEILGLRWEDVDLDARLLTVDHQLGITGKIVPLKGKDESARVIPFGERAYQALRDQRFFSSTWRMPTPEAFVFCTKAGDPLKHRTVQRHFQDAVWQAFGQEDVSFHTLRHTYASHMIEAGLSEVDLAYYLGHSSPSFTRRTYIHDFRRAERGVATRAITDEAFPVTRSA